MAIQSARDVFRGNPPSDLHKPDPSEIVDLLERIEAAAAGGISTYQDTKAALDLVSGSIGDIGFVLKDGTALNNGVYQSDGSVWSKISDLPEGFRAIQNGDIDNSKLADMAASRIKGRTAAGTGVPEDLTAAQVKSILSLGNVDNTADANKPVSTAQLAALNSKADASAISNVDNTSDASKPVSTAQKKLINVAMSMSQTGLASGSLTWSGTTATVAWDTARGVWDGLVVNIANLTATALAPTECLFVDLDADSSPYPVTKATTSSGLREDFSAGKKLQLVYNHYGALMGPLAGALVDAAADRQRQSVLGQIQIGARSATLREDAGGFVLSWDYVKMQRGGSVETIADLPETTLANGEALTITLADGSPYPVTKESMNSTLRDAVSRGDKIQLLYNNSSALVGPMAVHVKALEESSKSVRAGVWDPSEVVVRVAASGDLIDVYQASSVSPSAAYTRWRLARVQAADSDPGSGAAADVWAIEGVYTYLRTGQTTFDYVRRIWSEGVVECAVREKNKTDAMGGKAHGDEKLQRFYLLVDGRSVTTAPGADAWYRCQRVEFIQATELFEADTDPVASVTFADVVRRHVWQDSEMLLHNRVTFAYAADLVFAYLAMAPVERVDYQAPGTVLTSSARRYPLWEVEDISSAGFAEIEDSSHYIKWSGSAGMSMEVEVLEGWSNPNRNARVSNAAAYNKGYFDFVGEDYITSPGEVLEAAARYRIMHS